MRFDNKNVLGKHCFKYRQALSNARPSCPGRKEFSRADLVTWGLVVEMGTSSSQQVNGHDHGNVLTEPKGGFMWEDIVLCMTQHQACTALLHEAYLGCMVLHALLFWPIIHSILDHLHFKISV